MAFRIGRKPAFITNKSANPPAEDHNYWVTGTLDADEVVAAILTATPSALVVGQGTIYRQDVRVSEVIAGHWDVVVPYAKQDRSTGSLRWSFDTTGGTVHVKAAREHVATYPEGADEHGGSIGVHGEEVDGTDVVIPALKLVVAFRYAPGVLNMDMAKTIARNTGRCNDAPFMTFDAGEVLFLGGSGSDGTDAEAEVSFQFACSENLQDQVIAGIEGIQKDGWDYAWIEFEDQVGDAGGPTCVAKAVHVERVYERVDLAQVLGFG